MGTALARTGCLEALSRSEPALVREVHLAHLHAGAGLLRTNTFGCNRARLSHHGLEAEVVALTNAAVACAREAIAECGRAALLAGSIGPGAETYREQVEALAHAGVDLLFLETFTDLDDAIVALDTARTTGLPVAVLVSPDRDGRLRGATLNEVSRALADADAIGLNCGFGAAAVAQAFAALPIDRTRFAFPNAGLPSGRPDALVWPDTPADFATAARDLAAAGATVIGGCCGTTAHHLAALTSALAEGAAA